MRAELYASCMNALQAVAGSVLAQTTPAATVPTGGAEASKTALFTPEGLEQLLRSYGPGVLKAIAILIIGWLVAGWVSKLVMNACRRAKLDETLVRFLGNFSRWLVLAATAISVLGEFGIQVTSLLAILGSVGLAVGLALQGSFSHIASGVMLLIFRPFKVGDFVTAGGQTGIVNEVGLFSTTLDTLDNRRIIVPNGAIVGGVITNATHHGERVADVNVQTDAAIDLDKARNLLTHTANGVQGRLAAKPAAVALTAMGAANTWNVGVWCKTSEIDAVKERLLIDLNAAIGRDGLAPTLPVTLVKNVG
jgi:small conductance mechanosensitive channel